ncbi:MAG: ArsR/SmtB family transcription factor [Tepidanaerobacteraceae bacterium]
MIFKSLQEYKVQFLQGFGDKTRLKIIMALMEEEKTVSELVKELGCSQANISNHLKTLRDSGILKSRQEGKFVFYSLKDESVCEFVKYLDKMLLNLRKKALEGT